MCPAVPLGTLRATRIGENKQDVYERGECYAFVHHPDDNNGQRVRVRSAFELVYAAALDFEGVCEQLGCGT